ncbi:MAG: methylated-DNA--[protein]-cysteine S-methyltransferase [Veillonellaceae bacterium]|nr:methylated-DNA--[protein]-cysteine S-methyltransferase [Veillonellaceae bacterium]
MLAYFYETHIGTIGIAEKNGKIARLYFPTDRQAPTTSIQETPLLQEAAQQLQDYLSGKLTHFSLPLQPAGTAFMQQVWRRLCEIPYGETASYKNLAESLGKPNAARAVGMANHCNPIPIFIPCHRVIGANGSLVGYRGGLDLKSRLLKLEKERSHSKRLV